MRVKKQLEVSPKGIDALMRASEIRYRRLFNVARDGMLTSDSGTRKIMDANPSATGLSGCQGGKLPGKELWQIGLLQDGGASRAAFVGEAL
jgi:PAS domain-containing protein